jgi:hypothetical protein
MKDFQILDLQEFLSIADTIDHKFKFFEVFNDGTIRAEIWMRICLFSWEGEAGEDRIKALKEHGFIQAKLKETKRILIEELM